MNRRTLLMAMASGMVVFGVSPAHAELVPTSTIPAGDLILPPELVALLKNPAVVQPVVLHVGFRKLYAQAHIPGSDYAGPGGDEDGLKALSERVARLPKDGPIVIYCGCCPWSRCPNVAPAYDKLKEMGFTQVRVLKIDENFGADWVDKGYPAVTSP